MIVRAIYCPLIGALTGPIFAATNESSPENAITTDLGDTITTDGGDVVTEDA